MTIEEAEEFLKDSIRYELRDHAFGDREITWIRDKVEIASGYFSGSAHKVYIDSFTFDDYDAYQLLKCGVLRIERNDEIGPNEYSDGQIMEGLTKDAVLREITKP